jgi:glycerol-3-phosphate acyltransferase PlsY
VGTFKFPATFVVFLAGGGVGEPGGFELVLLELFVVFELLGLLGLLVLLEAVSLVEYESTVFKFLIVFFKKEGLLIFFFIFFKFRSRIKNLLCSA